MVMQETHSDNARHATIPSSTIVYHLQDLMKHYPGQQQSANHHITLQIYQGEIFGILGDNGAGKSTLVKQMVNLIQSTAGSIHLFGQPINQDPMYVPMHVGYMPQDSLALNNLTVGEAIYFTAHLRGLTRSQAQAERDRLLDLWRIRTLQHQVSSRLSGGQKRLLHLAVAMAGAPPVLILDEPTNDLDPQRRQLVWEILRQSNHKTGTTIIFITHDAIEAEKIIQRVGIMHAGTLVAVGRPSELKQIIDQKMRLELFFEPDCPPQLPVGLHYRQIDAGRWLILVEWQQLSDVLACVQTNNLDDFRLYSATLEDLYLHYATET